MQQRCLTRSPVMNNVPILKAGVAIVNCNSLFFVVKLVADISNADD